MVQSRFAAALLMTSLMGAGWPAHGQTTDKSVRIGVLTDMSGPYSQFAGGGSVVAAKLAVEDTGGRVLNRPVEVLSADHQNKPDVGSAIARKWFDVDGVDMITDLPASPVALAVQEIGRERSRIIINTSAATTELTGKACAPFGFHWVSDSYALSVAPARAVVAAGGNTWFFLTVDNAGGHATERDAAAAVTQQGGKVLGDIRHPIGTTDFGSFLMQGQASGAKVIGLANAGSDMVNAVKQSSEFGITQSGATLVGLFASITDVHAIGVRAAQGLVLTDAYYWDRDDASRAFAKRFASHYGGLMPTAYQAGVYSAVAHYLKSVAAAGTDAAAAVTAKMRAIPVKDFFAQDGQVREDGLMVHDMYLMRVKSPNESKGEWDLYKVEQTIQAKDAFRPMAEGGCTNVK